MTEETPQQPIALPEGFDRAIDWQTFKRKVLNAVEMIDKLPEPESGKVRILWLYVSDIYRYGKVPDSEWILPCLLRSRWGRIHL